MSTRLNHCCAGLRRALQTASLLILATTSCLAAAASLNQQIDPPEASVGDEIIVTFTVQNARPTIHFPAVDGLQVLGTSEATSITVTNGSLSSSFAESFHVAATHTGDFTIPAFDISTQDGGVLHTQPLHLHVVNAPNPAVVNNPAPAQPSAPAPVNPNGPVVMPPNTGSATVTDANISVPMGNDGRPAKVFLIITPKTTDAYVGESIPTRIGFYIRMDVDAQQNSLPTIRGSDFLMNNLSVHPREEEVTIMNEPYRLESWVTAISAPKNGDFPLQMEHDSYWTKSSPSNFPDPFGGFIFARPQLAHQNILSNQSVIHVHDLPSEGRPANFTGAIGQLRVAGTAQPGSVAVGEPVTLHFTVSGEGNFDYIRCPFLAPDPAWKSYVPRSKIDYVDESHTQGTKTFDQQIVPQKNGNLPLPAANFSYFDPNAKQYVTLPVSLGSINVTGTLPAAAAAPQPAATDSTSPVEPPQAATGLLPNRVAIGSTRTTIVPAYRQPWFWIVQASLVALLFLGAMIVFFRSRAKPDPDREDRALREKSLHQEEDAMSEAVRKGDASAFFLAARHTIQLQLGARWRVKPEALTLAEIRQRDPQLAETLVPLFTQADEVIYSGQPSSELDLAQWELHVRQELLQAQPV